MDDLRARNSLEVCISSALGVRRLWQTKLKDIFRQFDSAKQLRVLVSTESAVRIISFSIVEPRGEVALAAREVFADTLDHNGHLQDLFSVWSLRGLHLEQGLDEHAHIH